MSVQDEMRTETILNVNCNGNHSTGQLLKCIKVENHHNITYNHNRHQEVTTGIEQLQINESSQLTEHNRIMTLHSYSIYNNIGINRYNGMICSTKKKTKYVFAQ